MTVWIAGRQKMHYNGQQNCYPLQEGGNGGWGAVLTGRFSTPLYSYKHEMKPRGRAGSKPMEMSERFGRGFGHATLVPPCSALEHRSLLSVCQGQQANQIGQDSEK